MIPEAVVKSVRSSDITGDTTAAEHAVASTSTINFHMSTSQKRIKRDDDEIENLILNELHEKEKDILILKQEQDIQLLMKKLKILLEKEDEKKSKLEEIEKERMILREKVCQ